MRPELIRLRVENTRLRQQRDELVASIDDLGSALFGQPSDGKTWRDAKAAWWQRCVRAVDSVLLTCGGAAEYAVAQRSDCRPDERDMM